MNESYERGEEVLVTPYYFIGDKTYDCSEALGRVVYKQGVKRGALYTVVLLTSSSHGWEAGDTCRVKSFQLRKLTKERSEVLEAITQKQLDSPIKPNGVSDAADISRASCGD